MSEQKLQDLANSALLKLLQYLITIIMVPAMIWGVNGVLDRLGKIEEAVRTADKNSAMTEMRLANLERSAQENATTTRLLAEKVVGHDFQINSLKNLSK
jgi:hypothetical protein